jgi:hypothetical protein
MSKYEGDEEWQVRIDGGEINSDLLKRTSLDFIWRDYGKAYQDCPC